MCVCVCIACSRTTACMHDRARITSYPELFVFSSTSARARMSSPASSIADDPLPRPLAPTVVRARQRTNADGPLRVYAVQATAVGSCKAFRGDILDTWASPGVAGLIVGLVVACAWSFSSVAAGDGPGQDNGLSYLRTEAMRRTQSAEHFGYIEYLVKSALALALPIGLALNTVGGIIAHISDLLGDEAALSTGSHRRRRAVRDWVQGWKGHGASMGDIVKVAPAAALKIVSGRWASMNSIVITRRINRSLLLKYNEPSRRKVSAFLQSADANKSGASHKRPAVTKAPKWTNALRSAALVVDWVAATIHLKSLKRTQPAAAAFAKVSARNTDIPANRFMKGQSKVPNELLRLARVRIDCAAMLLNRRLWSAMCESSGADRLSVHLFTDASPQWRGLEMYASSLEIYDGDRIVRKLLPMVILDKSFMDASGETLAILWQLYLVVGGNVQWFLLFLSRVRSITTDKGVERKIADIPGVAEEFFKLIDPSGKFPTESSGGWAEHMFPRALAMPGWMHMRDLVLRRGLCSLPALPDWLAGLKAVVSFLRSTTNLAIFTRRLRHRGLSGVAALLEKAKLPHFAEWRWGTLLHTCDALLPIIGPIRQAFDPSLFAGARDGTHFKKVVETLRSKAWLQMSGFVHWFARWIGSIMSWGQGCACHQEDLSAGRATTCPLKGRRIKEAHSHAMAELRAVLGEANSWTTSTWGVGEQQWLDFQACVRASYHFASRKLLGPHTLLVGKVGRARCAGQVLGPVGGVPSSRPPQGQQALPGPQGRSSRTSRCDVAGRVWDGGGPAKRGKVTASEPDG